MSSFYTCRDVQNPPDENIHVCICLEVEWVVIKFQKLGWMEKFELAQQHYEQPPQKAYIESHVDGMEQTQQHHSLVPRLSLSFIYTHANILH